jgi:L-2-hydroxyglutarate oxidase
MQKQDFLIIGGGIIGLATAYELSLKYPNKKITILEKEDRIATHQSGRNSGVMHSGVYYKSGSLKATNCIEGKKLLEEFCTKKNIPFSKCGKIIVATHKDEIEKLNQLAEKKIGYLTEDFQKIEPYVQGILALHIPETGIIDYKEVCKAFGGDIRTNQKVRFINQNMVLTQNEVYEADCIINCAGLFADKIAEMCGIKTDIKIIPFRGEYYKLKPTYLCKGLIYPVPDPKFPFLGVHFTKMIDGEVECGPNAVLALDREGYSKWQFNEAHEILSYPGVIQLIKNHWKMGIEELVSSVSKYYYLHRLRKLIPAVQFRDLKYRKPGIRAQAMKEDGTLVDDIVIEKKDNWIHVLNAPSPAATACLSIAKYILTKV